MATLLYPPSGIIISAYLLEGSINCRCAGLTVFIYCKTTESNVLPLSLISLSIRLITLTSESVSTNILISKSSLILSSKRIKMPSKIIISLKSFIY